MRQLITLYSVVPTLIVLFGLRFIDIPVQHTMVEICDNAIDDDEDGLIDINDPDCECPVFEPVSRIPNPSFEDRTCCPQTRSSLNCAVTWIQASAPTTDYIHECGWLGWEQFPPPEPFPDGQAIVGFRDGRYINDNYEPNWKEYAGACLLAPLEPGISYRFKFDIGFSRRTNSPPINITFFGNTDCENLPFGGSKDDLGCPTNDTTGWAKLGAIRASGNNNWVNREIDVVPEDFIHAIAIGPACDEPTRTVSTYYFFDNLILDELESFEFQISALNHPCSETFKMGVPNKVNATYQWYKDGVALVGENANTLDVKTGPGYYQVRVESNSACKITRIFPYEIPSYETFVETYVCEGEKYIFDGQDLTNPGNYQAMLITPDNCDSLVRLNLNVIPPQRTQVSAKIFKGDRYTIGENEIYNEGEHEVLLSSALGCDSTIDLSLAYYKVSFPNIFSPNGDGINDYFNVFGEADLEIVKHLAIYSRWGEQLYARQDLLPNNQGEGWDGRSLDQDLPAGVYLFLADVQMIDGQSKRFSGEVTLVR